MCCICYIYICFALISLQPLCTHWLKMSCISPNIFDDPFDQSGCEFGLFWIYCRNISQMWGNCFLWETLLPSKVLLQKYAVPRTPYQCLLMKEFASTWIWNLTFKKRSFVFIHVLKIMKLGLSNFFLFLHVPFLVNAGFLSSISEPLLGMLVAHCINCYISGYGYAFFYNIVVNLIWGGLNHLPRDCDWLSGRQSEIKFLTGLVCRMLLFIMNLEALSIVHFTVMFLVIMVVRKS